MSNKWTDKGKLRQFEIMTDKFRWKLGQYWMNQAKYQVNQDKCWVNQGKCQANQGKYGASWGNNWTKELIMGQQQQLGTIMDNRWNK